MSSLENAISVFIPELIFLDLSMSRIRVGLVVHFSITPTVWVMEKWTFHKLRKYEKEPYLTSGFLTIKTLNFKYLS